jgi:hypothetical protein
MAVNNGTLAEGKVQKFLAAKSEQTASFCFERILDAKAAGGRFRAQAGDFQAFSPGKNWLLEVKSVAHDFRLPHGNFEAGQRARMAKRALAGTICVVLFYSTTLKLWRLAPLSFFSNLDGGSWDLRSFQATSLADCLNPILE